MLPPLRTGNALFFKAVLNRGSPLRAFFVGGGLLPSAAARRRGATPSF